MRKVVLAGAAAVLCVAVGACAVYFELNAKERAYHELVGLRGRTTTLLDTHRISRPEAVSLDSRLSQARTDLRDDDVGGAQAILDGVQAHLRAQARAA